MGSGTYKLLGAGALSAITSCLIFLAFLLFFLEMDYSNSTNLF